jgi:hypothetical protein
VLSSQIVLLKKRLYLKNNPEFRMLALYHSDGTESAYLKDHGLQIKADN